MLQSSIPGYPKRQGKVRDVYDLGDTLAIVASDRISAFDWVMPTGIPGKGRLLTAMTKFWFDFLKVPNHFLSDTLEDLPAAFHREELRGRTMHVRKTQVIPIECVARGYLAGSGWKEYRQNGTVCGIPLPAGLKEADKLPEPIFTPATKAEEGHDENIDFERMAAIVGRETAEDLKRRTLDIYRKAAEYAETKGIILADTKFEFGRLPGGEIIVIDEVLTPDSSRYWPRESYRPGGSPPSFDKQFLRDWLETTGWDKASPPPALPEDIVAKTAAKYREALDRLTG
ncbi:MAG: phosphoribosylaminoimidazolesuccinocarboxamide synthase [Gemmataceae bacterium]|nr:phosphoribosylaminoimidazolesuccinocarboxamide synthase [Gemmataceae bacterium]